nr:EGF domain-specific O-linked N-acetylglucosamine transferase isoform X1 [Leptinotarsa decemlineata]
MLYYYGITKFNGYTFIILTVFFIQGICDNYSFINLPEEHVPYYFRNSPKAKEKCSEDVNCPFKQYLNSNKCWGYESNCEWNEQYSIPHCPGDHKGWVKSKFAQKAAFHAQADFGYVKQQLNEMKVFCEPLFPHDSSLECSEHMRFCRGRNIMMNFTKLADRPEPIRYKMDVFSEGDIGGYCTFYKEKLDEQADHISPLQSWGPEMRYFSKLIRRPIVENDCDIVIEKPTFIMKIDATVNMYHHFCDFVNLYASLHLNATQEDYLSTDVHVLIWETFTYRSAFQDVWKAFTDHPLWDLKTFRGDTVCFKNVVFPLLPRMIFGLYYNTPIIYGCEKSGLFDAFSKHILHRLRIPEHPRNDKKIRITFLSRNTKYRRILNEDELIKTLGRNPEYNVKKVVYDQNIPFKKQLEISRNSDILVGIHGAGLTHLLFLPEWAAVFEVYNCEDKNCYYDLARLKGVKYITWENSEKLTSFEDGSYDGGAHAKFANYSFDEEEFLNLVEKAATHVKNHPKFKEYLKIDHDEF